MGRLPSMVIVTRHGPRIDAADQDWHLKSPAPYDPPLTYGGWKQSHALGARIASIVRDHEENLIHSDSAVVSADRSAGEGDQQDEKSSKQTPSNENKVRKCQLMIHSSPYLRCLQTSIAIGAGIAENQAEVRRPSSRGRHKPVSQALHSGSPQIHGLNNPLLPSIPEPSANVRQDLTSEEDLSTKPVLRVDAMLGEWLSPDYFHDITPPPDSRMMIAAAKAEMTRRGDYAGNNLTTDNIQPHEPVQKGLWCRGSREAKNGENGQEEPSTKAMAPRLARSSSHSVAGTSPMRPGPTSASRPDLAGNVSNPIYKQPAPSYAVSPSDPIPEGYVTFARDRCIDFDSSWDSMKPPQSWGDGGQLGESWSEMHTRLRKGLRNVLRWYLESEHTVPGTLPDMLPDPAQSLGDDGDDVDTILIIVTHSAACNALINALSKQPVLLDMATASLSLAVRKKSSTSTMHGPETPTSNLPRPQADHPSFDEYEVKFIASTDHLRGASKSRSRRTASRGSVGSPHSGWRSISSISAASAKQQASGWPDKPLHQENHLTLNKEDCTSQNGSSQWKSKPQLWTKPNVSHVSGLWKPPPKEPSKLRQVSIGASTPENEQSNPLVKPAASDFVSSPISEDLPQQQQQQQQQQQHDVVSKTPGLWGQLPDRTGEDPKKNLKRRWTHATPQT